MNIFLKHNEEYFFETLDSFFWGKKKKEKKFKQSVSVCPPLMEQTGLTMQPPSHRGHRGQQLLHSTPHPVVPFLFPGRQRQTMHVTNLAQHPHHTHPCVVRCCPLLGVVRVVGVVGVF